VYVSINKHIVSFRNRFGLLSRLCQTCYVTTFQMSPWATLQRHLPQVVRELRVQRAWYTGTSVSQEPELQSAEYLHRKTQQPSQSPP